MPSLKAPPATSCNKWRRQHQQVAAAAAPTKNDDDYDYDDCKHKPKKPTTRLARSGRTKTNTQRRTKFASNKKAPFAGGDFSPSPLRALFVSVAISLICLTATSRFAFREVAGSAAKLSAGTSAPGANQAASGGQVAAAAAGKSKWADV